MAWFGENSIHIIFSDSILLDKASWSGHTNTISHCTSSCIRVARPRDKGRVGTGTMCLKMVAGVANVPFMVTTSDTETDLILCIIALSSNDGAGIFEGILHFTLQPM